jgi:GT2 family glycosyltransferase
MMDWAAVIPTRGDRPDVLAALVGSIGPDRVVLVHTSPQSPYRDGCCNVYYEGPVNIQAWWQAGIEVSGARYAALVNDDTVVPPDCIPALVSALAPGYALAHPDSPQEVPKGWLFAIDRTRIAPDTGFQWWHGDDDLFRQAEHSGGIIAVLVRGARHLDLGEYGSSPDFMRMIEQDKARYFDKWGAPP